MAEHEQARAILDRELEILERRIAKSGPTSHYAIARFDALMRITSELQSSEALDGIATARAARRRLDTLARLHPTLMHSGRRPHRTIERSMVLVRDLLDEIAGDVPATQSNEAEPNVGHQIPIQLSGKMWRPNSHPTRPEH